MKRVLLVTLAIIFLFSFVLAGCSPKTIETSTSTDQPTATVIEETKAPDTSKAPATTAAVVEYKESPYFAGKGLPPVKDRLPKEPKITNEIPEDMLNYEIGTYGGILRTCTSDPAFDGDVFQGCNEPLLNSPGMQGKEITGNVLKGYEVSADQKEYTFHMREGMKWSDGTPVTSEDVRFTVEDFLFNKELTPTFPGWMCSGGDATGTPLKFTKVDDFTFKFSFDKPYGGLPLRIAIKGWVGYSEFLKPSAYLKKFHKKYADPSVLEAEIKVAKFKPGEWVNLFNDKDILNTELTTPKSFGFPMLYPWIYTKKTDITNEFERNPYYFKVDKAGNQLPYIDKIVSTFVQDLEVVNMKIITGEVDFAHNALALVKLPVYKDNELKGGYKTYTVFNDMGTVGDIYLNLTFKNDNWRKVVQDERFRKALNMGINRKEILDTIYFGLGEPSNIQDTTYDVVAANKLLDEMGMTKGADGFRKGPDGKKFTIPFEVAALIPDIMPITELVVEQWKELGLDVTMKRLEVALWATRNNANELQATLFWSMSNAWYMGDWGQASWGPLWDMYFNSAGKQGEKPPVEVQKLYDLLAKTMTDNLKDATVASDLLKAELKTHIWYFNSLSNVKELNIASVKIGNMPEKGYGPAANFSMEQFFFKK